MQVNRRAYQEELRRSERKYLNAAHMQIFAETEEGRLGHSIRATEPPPPSTSHGRDVGTDARAHLPAMPEEFWESPPSTIGDGQSEEALQEDRAEADEGGQ